MKREAGGQQRELLFDEAEAAFEERKNVLGLALMRIDADVFLCRLVERVFYLTRGGETDVTVVKSYTDLASRPWWLCCSKKKAISVVRAAEEKRVLRVERQKYASGSDRQNAYAISWDGVRSILLASRSAKPPVGEGTGDTPECTAGTGRSLPFTPSLISSSKSTSTEAAPGPDRVNVIHSTAEVCVTGFVLSDRLAVIPELQRAALQFVTPKDAGDLVYGAFACLLERHLETPATILDWHARQLNLPEPVVGATAAEAILCVAAGLYAARMRAEDVRKNRVAVFVSTVAKGRWERVLPYVREASKAVAGAIDQ